MLDISAISYLETDSFFRESVMDILRNVEIKIYQTVGASCFLNLVSEIQRVKIPVVYNKNNRLT